MKCPNCNTENRDGAKFCRNCGKQLVSNEQSIREKYPEYSFEPVSIMTNNGSKRHWICFLFFCVFSIVSMIGLIWIILKSVFDACYIGEVIGMSILVVLTVISILYSRIFYHKARNIELLEKYDYIENNETSSPYKFVVNNSKLGLVNLRTKKSQIPCEYDYLKWKSQDKILTATIGRDVFDIDIHGNRLK